MIAPKADLREALATTPRTASDWYNSFVAPSIAKVQTQGPRSVTVAEVNRGKVQFDQVRAAVRRLPRRGSGQADRGQQGP